MNTDALAGQVPPPRILVLCGTPGEMGFAQGRELRNEIGTFLDLFIPMCKRIAKTDFDDLKSLAFACEPYITPSYVEEMRALAEGSSTSYGEILALNCFLDLEAVISKSMLHCCNFVLHSPATQGGKVLHGRNLDFPYLSEMAQFGLVVVRCPDGAQKTLAVSWPPFVGLHTGCNQRRISVADVGAASLDSAMPGEPFCHVLRKALEKNTDIPGMVESIRSSQRMGAYNVAICDAVRGDAIAVEVTRRHFETRPAHEGILVVDDLCLGTSTSYRRLVYPAGVFRYARMVELITRNSGCIDEEMALSFLRDRFDLSSRRDSESWNCICNNWTVQSVLFSLVDSTLWLSCQRVPAPLAEYTKLNVESLLA